MNKLRALWANACKHAAEHREAYHHSLHLAHVSYLVTVTFHGPYTVAAAACLVIIGAGYAFRLELPDPKHPASTNPDQEAVAEAVKDPGNIHVRLG